MGAQFGGDECEGRFFVEVCVEVSRSLLDGPLHLRNVETLRRLAYIAEGKADNGERAATPFRARRMAPA